MSVVSANNSSARTIPMQRDVVGLSILLASIAFAGWSILNSVPLQSANDRSRWCTVLSLVERGTYHIDAIDADPRWHTIDKVRFRHDDTAPWHFYSSKPPLFSTIVAGVYWVQKVVTGDDLQSTPNMVSRRILLVVNLLPWCLALFSFRRSLRLLHVQGSALWVMLAVAGLCTMLNPYLNTLNNHTPAAVSLIFCLSAMVRISIAGTPESRDFAIVGITAAFTTCFELPAALFGIISFLFVVISDRRKTLTAYIPCAVLPLAAFFITNYIVTGGIKPFYAYYGKEPYVYVHEGVPSYWSSPRGIDANTESPWVYFLHCTIGHHGILSLTPVFLLSIAGWLGWGQTSETRSYRAVRWIGCLLTCVVLVFYLTRTQNYNYGGNSAALRWMLWLGPFWWYAMVAPVQRLTSSKSGLAFVVLLAAGSAYSSLEARANPWKPGWLFRRMESVGWIDYSTRVPPFNPPRYSVISDLSPNTTGSWVCRESGERLRLSAGEAITIGGDEFVPLHIELTSSSGSARSTNTVVFLDRFSAGQKTERWLAAQPDDWPESQPKQAAARWVANLLRGLPSSKPFNAEGPLHFRYVREDGSRWAIATDRGAARVRIPTAENSNAAFQRCDVRYSPDVPFGVAFWLVRTLDESSATLSSRRWVSEDLPQ